MKQLQNLWQFLLVLVFISLVSTGETYGQNVENRLLASSDLEKKGIVVSLEQLLEEIEGEYNVTFLYGDKVITGKYLNSEQLSFGKTSIGNDLAHILTTLNIDYWQLDEETYVLVEKKQPLISRSLFQQETITGIVTDASSGETLPGVNVIIKGTTIGTSTGSDGNYELDAPSLQDTLIFSFVGYQTQEVPINGRTTVNVSLQSEAIAGEELVVVGYGTQRSQDVTGSVGVVSNENIESLSISSPDQALTGQIAGVNVITRTGIPGGGPEIRIRGFNSMGAGGDPLYVVDGYALPQESGGSINPLADISPSDIENITVLKDASASAIYGSRANNGVIIITTRSGRSGSRQIKFNASSGISKEIERMKFDMANAEQFAEFQRFIWEDRQGAGTPMPDVYQNPQDYYDTDWFDLVRRDVPPVSYDANFSVSGGGENIRSYFSAGFRSDEGIIHNTNFTRVNLRANLDASLSDQLTVGLNLMPSYTKRNLPNVTSTGRGTFFGQPMMMSPLSPAYIDGELTQFPQVHVVSPATRNFPNPLFALWHVDQNFNGVRGIGNAFIDYDPSFVEGLSARATFNVDWSYRTEEVFNPSTVGSLFNPPPVIPEGEVSTDRETSISGDVRVNFNRELGTGIINAVGGSEIRHEYGFGSSFSGEFPGDEIRTMNVASQIAGNSTESEWSMISYFLRTTYTYDERYVGTGSIRTDGSSRFGSSNRWGTFYTGAVAWNLHNEDFFESDLFDEARLRASYGISGNNQIGNYSSLGNVVQNDYLFNSGNLFGGRLIDNLRNPALTWEKTGEWNVGVETSLFDYRLRVTVEAYQRTTEDMLLNRLLPPSSGFQEVEENLGDMHNRGLEITINSINVNQDNFTWSTDLTWSMYRNKVLALPGGQPVFGSGAEGQPAYISREGGPMGLMIGYVVGYNEQGTRYYTPEMIADPNVVKFPGAVAGNLIWEDRNGDGVIRPGAPEQGGDFDIIGNPHPDWSFGIVNTLSYRNWSLRMNVTGDIGHDIMRRRFFSTAMNIDGLFNVGAEYVEGFYRDENNPGSGHHPTPLGSSEARTRYRGSHSLNIYDGTHVWVRNATLRYNLPAGFAGISSSNVYLLVDNPWIITSYPGNPQASDGNNLSPGLDDNAYPLSTSFTLGMEISL